MARIPSYTWKSIWAAKRLLLSGLSWRVGDGSNIKIEEDAWVPNANGLLFGRGCTTDIINPIGQFSSRQLSVLER